MAGLKRASCPTEASQATVSGYLSSLGNSQPLKRTRCSLPESALLREVEATGASYYAYNTSETGTSKFNGAHPSWAGAPNHAPQPLHQPYAAVPQATCVGAPPASCWIGGQGYASTTGIIAHPQAPCGADGFDSPACGLRRRNSAPEMRQLQEQLVAEAAQQQQQQQQHPPLPPF
uniref:Uncharacterized protein n=1 Tax=Tetraselmis sp. GSL018 TaxID=582737 RepID=A0A061R7W2_9CHLO|eukprot:CAMPEP_0177598832 /NCGR_PEP_ID=MMETSP0419_2-20121207/12618_1 /TAXON_ID=582737 /ORGANISM="Tetraselmis sp., Strain GSL018" /LENGTH=174 /DNA_ID=CAMNT_0019091421 /DNA_START=320 /DNA_END=844 /DNA_ORIENTATION=+